MAFSHLSRPVRQVTGKTFASKFITLGKVITFWPEIVGEELAAKTYPVGMSVRKTGAAQQAKNGRKLEATLEISASSADATLIVYQKALILERLRTMLGDGLVVDMRVTHGGARAPRYVPPVPPPVSHLTDGSKTCLSVGTDTISDPELREALENLGRWIVN